MVWFFIEIEEVAVLYRRWRNNRLSSKQR